jgi:hypothetical protein
VDLQTLIAYTGTISNVFNYDRNAEFAKSVLQMATATNSECGQQVGNNLNAKLTCNLVYYSNQPKTD